MKHGIHHILLVTVVMIFASASDCSHFGPPTSPNRYSFLTGECLESHQLEAKNGFFNNGLTILYVSLYPNWNTQSTSLIHQHVTALLPAESVFNSLGNDAEHVRAEFYAEFNQFDFSHDISSTITVFYGEGTIITANREFCCIPAGENLFPSIAQILDFLNQDYLLAGYQLPQETVPKDCSITLPAIGCAIHYGESQPIDQDITFNIELPVKVGMYLHYLKDKHNTADAQMQYLDNVLSCDFTLKDIL